MSLRRIRPAWAPLDPAHLNDGLFVPTWGKRRGRLLVPQRPFGGIEIGYQGFEQLGANDQSFLLALTAQLGIDGLLIGADHPGEVSQQLRLALDFKDGDDGSPLATKRITLYSLLVDAGYEDPEGGKATSDAKEALNRLRSAQIREVNPQTGWDRTCNLIAVDFSHISGDIHVAVNPRLTSAVFNGQHIRVSLFERNRFESEISKLLHCWLCSNIRLGQALGGGNGAKLDTLAIHVWGPADWESASKSTKTKRRGRLVDALDEIKDQTRQLHGGYGWAIDHTSSGLVMVSRPKELPLEEWFDMTPSQMRPRPK